MNAEEPDAPRPTGQQFRESCGEALGGWTLGALTPALGLIGFRLLGEFAQGQTPTFPGMDYFAFSACVLGSGAAVVGFPVGSAGAVLAFELRRRRRSEWPEGRTAFCGAYLGGTLTGFTCCVPLFNYDG